MGALRARRSQPLQLMLTLWEEGPARTLALARLEGRGVVSRSQRWRFSEWLLEHAGTMHLELLEPIWHEVDETLRSEFGRDLVTALVREVDRLPALVPREGRGWFD